MYSDARTPIIYHMNDWNHENAIRAIHRAIQGRGPRDLCPDCGSPTTVERGVAECGYRDVRECRCGWTDFDEITRERWISVNRADPLAALLHEEM